MVHEYQPKKGVSLRAILVEERNYWVGILDKSNNRLLSRVASNNIHKRSQQLRKLSAGIPILSA